MRLSFSSRSQSRKKTQKNRFHSIDSIEQQGDKKKFESFQRKYSNRKEFDVEQRRIIDKWKSNSSSIVGCGQTIGRSSNARIAGHGSSFHRLNSIEFCLVWTSIFSRFQYEKMSPKKIFQQFRSKSQEQGNCLIPHWLALLLANLLFVLIFGLMTSAIMLSQNPPGSFWFSSTENRNYSNDFSSGKENTVTAEPLKGNLSYNSACFTWDNSCDLTKQLWCVNDRCQCYDQLTYWNGSNCVFCRNGSFFDGISCSCPSYSFPDLTSTNTCRQSSIL